MITTDPREFLERFRALEADRPGLPRAILQIIDPEFEPGTETAEDNRYMDLDADPDERLALRQQFALTKALTGAGLPVLSFPVLPGTPDGVFCNNAFATIPGRLIVGAMCFPNRSLETRREDIPALLGGWGYELLDLSQRDLVAELTGVLIIDRARGVGLCGMTGRVDAAGCEALHEAFDLRLTFRFDLAETEYHTNVVMSVLANRALVIHPGSFADPAAPEAIIEAYGREHTLILSDAEKLAFAGNCLAVTDRDVMMSAAGFAALAESQRAFFVREGFEVSTIDVGELETGGGSVRCLIGEIF